MGKAQYDRSMPDHDDGADWLRGEEERAWRAFQLMQMQLTAVLTRQLATESGLSLTDYAVLVALTAQEGQTMRAFELGRVLGWEKSRVSHHLARMERRGLIERSLCPADARGSLVAITPRGLSSIEAAAPGHVRAVRAHFIDLLDADELAVLADVGERVLRAISCPSESAAADSCPNEGAAAISCPSEGAAAN